MLYCGTVLQIIRTQNHKCGLCDLNLLSSEKVEIAPWIDSTHNNWKFKNLLAVHPSCHDYVHISKSEKLRTSGAGCVENAHVRSNLIAIAQLVSDPAKQHLKNDACWDFGKVKECQSVSWRCADSPYTETCHSSDWCYSATMRHGVIGNKGNPWTVGEMNWSLLAYQQVG